MAMSAFRSTTRRNCQIGGYSSSVEGAGVPSTPRSKRDPSASGRIGGYSSSAEGGAVPSTPRSKKDPFPSGRGSHRRSASVTDFSARYLSDCSSTRDYHPAYNKNSRTGCHSVCPSDSESDMDSLTAHRRRSGRWVAESEDERPSNRLSTKTGSVNSDHKGLRRTLSSQDFSQAINLMKHHVPVLDKKREIDDTEDLVEEKTIRAVYAQMKSLHTEPPVGDVGMTDFLDAMRAEIRRAVSDIRQELEESMQKNGKISASKSDEGGSQPQGTGVIQAVAGIRKEYTTKLEESEKRVRELWSQIAVEERRCLELSKIVKELLPTQSPAQVQTSTAHGSSNRRRPLRRKNSAERHLDLKSLDEEAHKYFEDCVSISSYDCRGGSDDSMQEKENSSRQNNGREVNIKVGSSNSNSRGEPQRKGSSVGSDGVVLPWLQWEAEAGAGGDKMSKQAERNGKVPSGKSSPFHKLGGSRGQHGQNGSTQSGSSKNLTTGTRLESDKSSSMTTLSVPVWSESAMPEINSNGLKAEQETGVSSSTMFFSLDDIVTQNDEVFLDVESLLFEKIKYRCRVEKGELLLCQGLFFM